MENKRREDESFAPSATLSRMAGRRQCGASYRVVQAWLPATPVRSKPTGQETVYFYFANAWLNMLRLFSIGGWLLRTMFWLCLRLLRTSARFTAMMSSVASTRA